MTENIIWEEPPAPKRGRGASQRHVKIAETLKSNPGQWARVATGERNDNLAMAIRKTGASFRTGRWEARGFRAADGTYNIFARYLGK